MHSDTDFANPAGRRIGGLALIRSESGAVLLVKPTYKGGWQLPGGGALPDEHAYAACAREVLEETGLPVTPGRLLLVDYVPRSEGGSAEGYNFVYDGGVVPDGVDITLPDAKPGEERELSDYDFVSPGSLGTFARPYQERRVKAALAALVEPAAPRFLVLGEPA
jgi:8-oxo-dGTP pyrophosphatase MutT (NUDIX family)